MSEQSVNAIAQNVNNTVQLNLTLAAAAAALLGGPNSELAKWLDAGNDIDTSFKLPRKYLESATEELKEKGVVYQLLDQNTKSEYVSIAIRGASKYYYTETGEYTWDNGGEEEKRRLIREGERDRQVTSGIAAHYCERYEEDKKLKYSLDKDEANKHFKGKKVMSVSNLSYYEALMLQQMACKNCLYNQIRYDVKSDSFSVEFEEEKAERPSISEISLVELSIQQSLMALSRPKIIEWSKEQDIIGKKISNYIKGLDEEKKDKSMTMTIAPANGKNERLEIYSNKTARYIDNSEFGKPVIRTFDLNIEEDFTAFEEITRSFDSKFFVSTNELGEASDIYYKSYQDYVKELDIARYEAEKLTDFSTWKVKINKPEKADSKERFVEARIPDSKKIVDVLKKDGRPREQAFYDAVRENMNTKMIHMTATVGAAYELVDDEYEIDNILRVKELAKEQNFDYENVSEEERIEFFKDNAKSENVENAPDEERENWFLDTNQDGIDDRDYDDFDNEHK